MELATWILVVMLSVTLLIFLIAGIVLAVKLIRLTEETGKIVNTGQQIATKADDIVDNIKGVTSVGGIVKTFAGRVIENQERRYAAEDALHREEETLSQAKPAETTEAEPKKPATKTTAKAEKTDKSTKK